MSALDLNLAAPLRDALINDAGIVALLGSWNGEASVFTRRPTPEGATYPLLLVNPDTSISDQDWITAQKPIVRRDIAIYGQHGTPGSPTDQLRAVDSLGYLIRALFHDQRFSISVAGHHVVEIRASGPMAAPTDDAKLVGRIVSLAIHLQALA